MARCCPDHLDMASWREDAPYVWEQTLQRYGEDSLHARVMRMRFGFDGAEPATFEEIAGEVGLKTYRVAETVQAALQAVPMRADDVPVQVLFEDESVLAVAKPPRINVTPRNRNRGGALLNRALHHLRKGAFCDGDGISTPTQETHARDAAGPAGAPGDDGAPYVVHRLDYNTSGVVLFAKTRSAAAHLAEQLRDSGKVTKCYLALCGDGPAGPGALPAAAGGWFEVDGPIGREDRSRQMVRPDGKKALTWCRVIPAAEDTLARLLLARPVTGRTHQIRVHAAHAGLPLLADEVYGVESSLLSRHALHAWRVAFSHPASGERIQVSAPLPDDFSKAMDQLGLRLPADIERLADIPPSQQAKSPS